MTDRMVRKVRVETRGPTRDGTEIGTLLVETPAGLFSYRQSLYQAARQVGMSRETSPKPSLKVAKFETPEEYGYDLLSYEEAEAIAKSIERLGGLNPKTQIKPIEPNGERDGSRLVGGRFRP